MLQALAVYSLYRRRHFDVRLHLIIEQLLQVTAYLTTRHLASEGPVSNVGYPCGPAKMDKARLPGLVLSSSLLRQASAIRAGSVTWMICMGMHVQ